MQTLSFHLSHTHITRQLYQKWQDPIRGTVPLGWALNPNLSKRFPLIFEMVYQNLSPMDRITSGDSGAGYTNPTQFFTPRKISGLPDGSALWRQWCMNFYQKFDLKFTGFLLNGKAGHMTHQVEFRLWPSLNVLYGFLSLTIATSTLMSCRPRSSTQSSVGMA